MGRKGFTLIELMIVIVIIGILAAIVFPNFIIYKTNREITEKLEKGIILNKEEVRHLLDNMGALSEKARNRAAMYLPQTSAGIANQTINGKEDVVADRDRKILLLLLENQRIILDMQRRILKSGYPDAVEEISDLERRSYIVGDMIEGLNH